MTEPTTTPKQKHIIKPKKAKTTDNTNVNTPPHHPLPPTAPETETQPETQPQPQRLQDAIKAHQNAIDFIHTAIHRTDCAIQLLTRNGYFGTVQHLQQAKVHLRESERSCRSMIRTIRDGNQ